MQLVIDIITTRKDIYHALVDSGDNQSIIGIASNDLGPGMFMTSVREIIAEGYDILIVLNSYDTSGYFLEKKQSASKQYQGRNPFQSCVYQSLSESVRSKRTPGH